VAKSGQFTRFCVPFHCGLIRLLFDQLLLEVRAWQYFCKRDRIIGVLIDSLLPGWHHSRQDGLKKGHEYSFWLVCDCCILTADRGINPGSEHDPIYGPSCAIRVQCGFCDALYGDFGVLPDAFAGDSVRYLQRDGALDHHFVADGG